jgi:non-specific serine/threonine protein kinase
MCLGGLTFFRGDLARASATLDEGAALGRTAGEWWTVAFALGLSALAELERGNLEACTRLAADSVAAGRQSATPWASGPAYSCLAYLAMHEGDLERAGRLHEELLEQGRQQGDKWGVGIVLFDLALLRVVQGRYAEARTLVSEGIALYQEFEDPRGIAWCLGILSAADAAEGHAQRAARLRGAMEGLLDSVGAAMQESINRWIGDPSVDTMKKDLGHSGYQAAVAEGRAMSLSRAIQFGLDAIASEADQLAG